MRGDRSDKELAFPAHLDLSRRRRNPTSDLHSRTFVTPRGQTGGLTGRVDTTHLH